MSAADKKQQKCISIRQPWASLLVLGIKRQESRNWTTKFRGKLWVAASKKKPNAADLKLMEKLYSASNVKLPDKFPTGCVIGYVIISDVIPKLKYTKHFVEDDPDKNDCPYKYAWICTGYGMLREAVPIKGRLNIYDLPPDIHASINRAGVKAYHNQTNRHR